MTMRRVLLLVSVLVPITLPAVAEDATTEIDELIGPAAPRGLSVEELGDQPLGREFADNPLVATRALRARLLTLEPGGVVPIHSHDDRPAITYVTQGEVLEYRSDSAEPILRQRGDVTFDGDGIAQWWENVGDEAVIFYVVDFFDTGSPPDH